MIAVCNLIKKPGLEGKYNSKEEERVNLIMRLLMEARMGEKHLERLITKKYESKRFECVATGYF